MAGGGKNYLYTEMIESVPEIVRQRTTPDPRSTTIQGISEGRRILERCWVQLKKEAAI